MSRGEWGVLFGNPDDMEFDHIRDNSKASRVGSIFERDISGCGDGGKIQFGH